MNRSKLIKGLTLLSFIFFITTFLLYRTGKFDSYLSSEKPALQTSPNGGTINPNKKDTLKPVKQDSARKLMMSSSKSMILTDKVPGFTDSIKKYDSSGLKKTRMMSGSKSAIIFTPPVIKPEPGTLKFDTARFKKKNN